MGNYLIHMIIGLNVFLALTKAAHSYTKEADKANTRTASPQPVNTENVENGNQVNQTNQSQINLLDGGDQSMNIPIEDVAEDLEVDGNLHDGQNNNGGKVLPTGNVPVNGADNMSQNSGDADKYAGMSPMEIEKAKSDKYSKFRPINAIPLASLFFNDCPNNPRYIRVMQYSAMLLNFGMMLNCCIYLYFNEASKNGRFFNIFVMAWVLACMLNIATGLMFCQIKQLIKKNPA